MAYVCYVYSADGAAPHMEVLPDERLDAAILRARALMSDQGNSTTAQIWDGDILVRVVSSGERPFPADRSAFEARPTARPHKP